MQARKRCNQWLLMFVSILAVFTFSNSVWSIEANNNTTTRFSQVSVLVKFKSSTSASTINNELSRGGCSSNSASMSASSPTNGWVLASIDNGASVSQTVNFFASQSQKKNSVVLAAEPNFIVTTSLTPNDPSFPSLWGLENTGQVVGGVVGVPGADISAVDAWDVTTGSNIVIAITDTGLDYLHEDIDGNMWINPNEIAGNGIDDDGNGYIDDTNGWDWVNLDNDPLDDNGHGTHVSGTIAAVGDNAIGVTGINWTARIMPLKFLSAGGAGTAANAALSIDYAVVNGAQVINASWGGGAFSQAIFDAITAADAAGILFVAAAGNAGTNTDITPAYPASYDIPNIISVAATDNTDSLAGFSNFGLVTVDLGAPGVSILSSVPTFVTLAGYTSFSGTSMASPHVAGVAGLVLSEATAVGTPLTVADLKAAILDAADPNAALSGITVTGGRLNAANAVAAVAVPPVIISPAGAETFTGAAFAINFSGSGGSGSYTWTLDDTTVATVSPVTGSSTVLTGLLPGSVILTATDLVDTTITGSTTVNIFDPVITVTALPSTVDGNTTSQLILTGGSGTFVWTVSPALGTIDPATLVFTAGTTAGTAAITATDTLDATISGSTTITVTDVIVPIDIVVTSTADSVDIGSTITFSATGGTPPFTFQIIDLFPTVASINATTGILTGVSVGIVDVLATDSNGFTGLAQNIVVTDPTATLVLTPNTALLNVGDTQTFSVVTGLPGMVTVTWETTNTNIASIVTTGARSGLLTSEAEGVTLVIATARLPGGGIFNRGVTGIIQNSQAIAGAGTNQPPSIPLLLSPANNAQIGTTVNFEWSAVTDPDGDVVTYELSYCTSRDFSVCPSSVVTAKALSNNKPTTLLAMSSSSGLLFVGLIGLAGLRYRRLYILSIIVVSILAISLVSCSRGSSEGEQNSNSSTVASQSNNSISATVSGLDSGTTYYWKVVANDGKGGLSSSVIRSFITR